MPLSILEWLFLILINAADNRSRPDFDKPAVGLSAPSEFGDGEMPDDNAERSSCPSPQRQPGSTACIAGDRGDPADRDRLVLFPVSLTARRPTADRDVLFPSGFCKRNGPESDRPGPKLTYGRKKPAKAATSKHLRPSQDRSDSLAPVRGSLNKCSQTRRRALTNIKCLPPDRQFLVTKADITREQ